MREPFVVQNEFASASVAVVERGSFSCLVIVDSASGTTISLDALEVQSLAWAGHDQLAEIVASDNRLRRLNG
jgi:hypothetical protein